MDDMFLQCNKNTIYVLNSTYRYGVSINIIIIKFCVVVIVKILCSIFYGVKCKPLIPTATIL